MKACRCCRTVPQLWSSYKSVNSMWRKLAAPYRTGVSQTAQRFFCHLPASLPVLHFPTGWICTKNLQSSRQPNTLQRIMIVVFLPEYIKRVDFNQSLWCLAGWKQTRQRKTEDTFLNLGGGAQSQAWQDKCYSDIKAHSKMHKINV